MKDGVTLLLVDDHPVLLEGLAVLLDVEPDLRVVGTAADPATAFALWQRERPDVTLLDLRLAEADGLDLLRRIRAADGRARVLVLSTFDHQADIAGAMAAGAAGYLLKSTATHLLVDAVRRVASGLRILPEPVLTQLEAASATQPLTPRESQILELVCAGGTNRDIAMRLGIKEATVKEHLSHVFLKLGVESRTQAIRRAASLGLVRLGSAG